jgi:hypothetical protein
LDGKQKGDLIPLFIYLFIHKVVALDSGPNLLRIGQRNINYFPATCTRMGTFIDVLKI